MRKHWSITIGYIYLFIDFQKSYDSVHRDILWKYMEEFKILKKKNMCRARVQKTRSSVSIEGTLSSFSKIIQD